jgi:hypothetical protein
MSSSVVLHGRGPLSRSVRYSRTADGVPVAMTAGPFLENHTPPRGLAHHVRPRAPGAAGDEAPARVDNPDPARIAEDSQLDLPPTPAAEAWHRVAARRHGVDPVGARLLALRARLRGRTDP